MEPHIPMRRVRHAAGLLLIVNFTAAAGSRLVQAQPCAYVANLKSNDVSVINIAANAVTSTIPVGKSPDGIAVSADGRFAYVANFLSNDVSVIDTAANAVSGSIPVGAGPVGIAAGKVGEVVAVANKVGHTVSLLSATERRVTASVPVDGTPEGIVVPGNEDAVYVTTSQPDGPGSVAVISMSTKQVVTTIPVGVRPNRIALTRYPRVAYVTNFGSFNISVLDLSRNAIMTTIGLSLQPSAIAITPDDRYAYVTNADSSTVSIIPTASNAVRAAITVGLDPSAVAARRNSPLIHVANFRSDTVSVISRREQNHVNASIPVGSGPFAIAISGSAQCAVSPTATPAPQRCFGDCNGNGRVEVDEVLAAVNIVLGSAPVASCPAIDPQHTGSVTVAELLQMVKADIEGCALPTLAAARSNRSNRHPASR